MKFLLLEAKRQNFWYKTLKVELLLDIAIYLKGSDKIWKNSVIDLLHGYSHMDGNLYIRPNTFTQVGSEGNSLIILK